MTQKLLSCNDIPRFMVMISCLGSAEVMALHIDTFSRKESLYPACVITSWIVSRSWWEHGIIVFGFHMLLVCIYSVNDCFIENHQSLSRFLGIEVHSGATLLVQSIFQDIFERRANNVLNAQCSLVKQLHHCVCLRATLLGNADNLAELFVGESFVLPLSFPKIIHSKL